MYEDMLEKVVLMRWCWFKSMKNSLVLYVFGGGLLVDVRNG